jgi:hypothetical protein
VLGDGVSHLGGLVLAEFCPGVEAVDAQAQSGSASGRPSRRCLVLVQAPASRSVLLEVVGQPGQDREVLLLVEDPVCRTGAR